ncbi:MAG: NAD(P)-dependent oxidoreductase [Rubrivivax sp.]|nr:NAD(P)-dependent oxidoreductase [Rubrivivax sp.]
MIGVVGIGNMGLAMALRLRDSGHAVAVRDVDVNAEAMARAEGLQVFPTPAALARTCELVILAVVDGPQTQAVLFGPDGIADGLAPGGAVLLCPTISPEDVESAAAGLAAQGAVALDAPMSGGPARARDGSMSLMVACDDAAWARWQPLLAQLASRLFRVGKRPGDGARTKLVNNLLAAVNLAGAAEVLRLAEALGLDATQTLEVIEQSSGQSWIGSDRARRVLAGDSTPRAHMRLLAKDSALALAAAQRAGLALPVGQQAAEAFLHACRRGLDGADDSALWRAP